MLQQRLTRNLYTGQTEPLTAPLSFDFTEDLGDKRNLALLSQYGGAAAAYSLRALGSYNENVVRVRRASDNDEKDFTASQVSSGEMVNWVNSQTVPPLDIGVETSEGRIPVPEGGTSIGTPAAAYSLRNLSTTYTGSVVDVRRSSDNAVESFTAAEVSDGTLEDWVNEDVVVGLADTLSDFSATRLIRSDATVEGEQCYKFVLDDSTDTTHYSDPSNIEFIAGRKYNLSFKYYIPAGQTVYRLNLNYGGYGDIDYVGGVGAWQQANLTFTATQTRQLRIFAADSNISVDGDASGEFFALQDVTLTQVESEGYVSKWYDQSGNNNHAVQTTAASQPKIVDGGSLVTNDGNAVVNFQSIDNRHFIFGAGLNLTARTVFYAGKPADINFHNLLGNTSNSSTNYIRTLNNAVGRPWETDPSSSIFVDGSAYAGGDVSAQGYSLNTFVFDSDATVDFLGGAGGSISDTPIVDASEIIIYDSDQSDNRTAIEANIGETYGISGIPAYDNTVDGFVETWYDQSGNGNDATQSVAASQPKIVDAGVLLSDGLDFDGTDDFLEADTVAASFTGTDQPLSSFAVGTVDVSANQYIWAFGNSASDNAFNGVGDGTGPYRMLERDDLTVLININGGTFSSESLLSFITKGNQRELFANGSSIGSDSTDLGAKTFNKFQIGRLLRTTALGYWNGKISEVIIYPSDQSNNRLAIEANIGETYGISGIPAYDNTVDGFVETWYDQSGNGNDATQSVAANQPKIVDAGVLITRGGASEPSILFGGGADNHFNVAGGPSVKSVFSTLQASDTNFETLICDTTDNTPRLTTYNGANNRVYVFNGFGTPSVNVDGATYNGTSSVASLGFHLLSITSGTGGEVNRIGANPSVAATGNSFNYVSELVIYDSDQSANRTAIEANINNQYSIY